MVRYYCDRCGKEIKSGQYLILPPICQYKEEFPINGTIDFTMVQSDCSLCVDCMRKYINFIKGGDNK